MVYLINEELDWIQLQHQKELIDYQPPHSLHHHSTHDGQLAGDTRVTPHDLQQLSQVLAQRVTGPFFGLVESQH